MTDILSLEQKPAHVLRNHNFRLLWIGEGISLLGDQFYLIALPWLVLSLTGNPLAVGTVLAMAGIPRAQQSLIEARKIAARIGCRRMLWRILAELGDIAEMDGRMNEAQTLRAEAREIFTYITEHCGSVEIRTAFLAMSEVG